MKTLLLLLTLAVALGCLHMLTDAFNPVYLRQNATADLSNLPAWLAALIALVSACLLVSPFFKRAPKVNR